MVHRTLAGAHAGLGGLRGDGLIREDADPHLATALDIAVHGDTGGLDLARLQPGRLERLQGELAEGDGVAAVRRAAHAAAVLFAVLGSGWGQQHDFCSRWPTAAAAPRTLTRSSRMCAVARRPKVARTTGHRTLRASCALTPPCPAPDRVGASAPCRRQWRPRCLQGLQGLRAPRCSRAPGTRAPRAP